MSTALPAGHPVPALLPAIWGAKGGLPDPRVCGLKGGTGLFGRALGRHVFQSGMLDPQAELLAPSHQQRQAGDS